jgi:hypothetical protein
VRTRSQHLGAKLHGIPGEREIPEQAGVEVEDAGRRMLLRPLVPNRTSVTGANAFGSK